MQIGAWAIASQHGLTVHNGIPLLDQPLGIAEAWALYEFVLAAKSLGAKYATIAIGNYNVAQHAGAVIADQCHIPKASHSRWRQIRKHVIGVTGLTTTWVPSHGKASEWDLLFDDHTILVVFRE